MSAPGGTATGTRSGGALQELTAVALGGRPGTLADVAAVLGRATGARGVVLWEAPAEDGDELYPLCAWRAAGSTAVPDSALELDPVSREAHRGRTLALPGAGDASLLGLAVSAALPFEYPGGSGGVLTLCGADSLDGGAFDTAAELLDVVPRVLAVLRERTTLGLVNACGDILHEADVESGSEPLPRKRLAGYFGAVCARLAGSLPGAEVSLYLDEPGCEGQYGYLASWPPPPIRDRPARSRPATLGPDDVAPPGRRPDRHHFDQRVMSGTHTWGVLRCTRPDGPSDCFSYADFSLLAPVAAQLARYWGTWLNRRALSEENRSWRELATGITDFNEVLADALRRGESPTTDQWTVDQAALRVAAAVVPLATGAAVFSAAPAGKRRRSPLVVTARLGSPGSDAARHDQAARAYGSGLQRTAPTRAGAAGEDRWMMSTPIRVGYDQAYGVLTAEGVGTAPPANSAQVYDILSDQLGLYRHLERTMSELRTAQRELRATLTAQAEVMEDLKHQLVSPLRAATDRTDLVLRRGRFDRSAQRELAAARGLCRKASRVAMSAGVFAALSKGQRPAARSELLGGGDLLRMLIAAADDCRILSNPEMRRQFEVDRASLNGLGRTLVHADTSFLQQCVGNLLDNADKYSYPETEVVIAAELAERQLRITVTSTGVPLPPEDRGHCLERSWRGAEALNACGEGSGIGLWIVDNLMRSMRGRVEILPTGNALTVGLVLPAA